ncbi:MAG: hypothetical protein SVS85_00110, partial [Candidatus Nanohaloarchaea archaeon]|nr:hypothetical protein [Candidatus Nanohaloarchaea archaeon]
SCPTSMKAMVSIYDPPSSHIAEPGHYKWQLCGAFFFNVTMMTELDLGPDETVSLNGTENPSEGVHQIGPPSFISVSNGSLVSGIVSGEGSRPYKIGYRTEGGDQVFNMTQSRTREVSYYFPFTTGTDAVIQNRLPLIAAETFMDQFNPNFGLNLLQEMLVDLTLSFTDIDIVTDARLSPGSYRLIIENVGKQGGETQVSINATTP